MNWNYFKFTKAISSKSVLFFSALLLLSSFIPTTLLGAEEQCLLLGLIAIVANFRGTSYDLLAGDSSPGRSTSMKYLLSLNMSKKEFFYNYICSKFFILTPALLAFVLVHLKLTEFENPLKTISLSLFLGGAFILFFSLTHFYKKFFIHKGGTFQEQFFRGKQSHRTRLVLSFASFVIVLFFTTSYFNIRFLGYPLESLLLIGLGMPVVFIFTWHLYFPLISLFLFYKFKASLRDFTDPHFFERPFWIHAREVKISCAIMIVTSSLFLIELPSSHFKGNPLTEAIELQDLEKIKKLAQTENLHTPASSGLTPLAAAILTGQYEVYQLLKKNGAEIPSHITFNNKLVSLLDLSIRGKNAQILDDLLISSSFDLNQQTEKGRTLLHQASATCRGELVEILIQYGADVNIQDKEGRSPLHLAVEKSCNDVGLILLSKGADPHLKDQKNRVALDLKKGSLLPFLENQLRRPASIETE